MAVTAKQLLEERVEIITKARKINDDHRAEDGTLPAEFQEQFDKAMEIAAAKKKAADDILALETAENPVIEDPRGKGSKGSKANGEAKPIMIRKLDFTGKVEYEEMPAGVRGQEGYHDAFCKYLRHGDKGLAGLGESELSALQSDDSESAGYLVGSQQFASGLLQTLDDMVFIRRLARVYQVPEADDLGIRARTAKASTFAWSSELTVSDADTSLKFGKRSLHPKHLTGQIEVSRDLLRRSTMGVDGIVRGEGARDAGEVQEQAFLTGSGAGQPLGVFTASSNGISTARDKATGSATGFTADGLVAAKYMLKQGYRNGGSRSGARWMFHRDGISKISQLKDGENHYMLQPARGLTGDEWDTLLGYPVDESEFAPNTYTDGLYSGILGNWSYYAIADALDMEVQVLLELLARQNLVAYIFRLKTDGMPVLEEAFVRLKCATS